MVLFFNKDDQIKKAALDSYQWLYLKQEYSWEVKAHSLIELLKDADSTEEACVEEFLSVAIKEKIVDSDVYKSLWKKYTETYNKKPAEKEIAWICLKILWIAAEVWTKIDLNDY